MLGTVNIAPLLSNTSDQKKRTTKKKMWEKLRNHIKNYSLYKVLWQFMWQIAMGWAVHVSNPGGASCIVILHLTRKGVWHIWIGHDNVHSYKFIMCWMNIQCMMNLYAWKVLLDNPSINYSFPELFVTSCSDVFCRMFLMFCSCYEYSKCMMWVMVQVIGLVRFFFYFDWWIEVKRCKHYVFCCRFWNAVI
jgi:hypothetical protein